MCIYICVHVCGLACVHVSQLSCSITAHFVLAETRAHFIHSAIYPAPAVLLHQPQRCSCTIPSGAPAPAPRGAPEPSPAFVLFSVVKAPDVFHYQNGTLLCTVSHTMSGCSEGFLGSHAFAVADEGQLSTLSNTAVKHRKNHSSTYSMGQSQPERNWVFVLFQPYQV